MATPHSSAARRQGRPPVIARARERILDEAARLFAANGYESGSINELAAAVGVSKAAIYHYFPTKQDIYDGLILRTLQSLGEHVAAEVGRETRADARLRRFMLAHAGYFEAHHAAFTTMLVGYSGMGTALREDAARLRDAYEQSLRDIVSQGMEDGVFRRGDPATAARAVLSMLNWMARWYKPAGERSAAGIAADYYELIAGGLCRPAPTPSAESAHGTGR